MTVYAGLWGPDTLEDSTGPAPSTSVSVYVADSVTLATLYTDRTKGTTASNPTLTDALGNLHFYVDPGYYDVVVRGNTYPVVVYPDPADVGTMSGLNVLVGSSDKGTRQKVNLIAGAGVTVTATDNSGTGAVDITFTAPTAGLPGGAAAPLALATSAAHGASGNAADELHVHPTTGLLTATQTKALNVIDLPLPAGNIATGTAQCAPGARIEYATTASKLVAYGKTAPTGADAKFTVVRVRSGVTTTIGQIVVTAGTKIGKLTTSLTNTDLVEDDLLDVNVDQVGSSVPGADWIVEAITG